MKTLLTLIILTLTTFGCSNEQTLKDEKLTLPETQVTNTIFKQVADFPFIEDTTKFIADLRQIFKLEVDEKPVQKANEKITTFKKVKIYGSDNEYFFIEYDCKAGSGKAFPFKYQLLLTTNGKPVKALSRQRYQFVEIFKNENPFLMTVVGTSKGNGGHELYKISGDTLENAYEGYYNYAVQTYDAHEDNKIYEPKELTLNVKDFNHDGFNDISFNGKIVLIQGQTKNGDWFDTETLNGKEVHYSIDNPFKKISVEFIFLYDKQNGHFKAKENYNEKYGLDD
jgi:hypothetical protein